MYVTDSNMSSDDDGYLEALEKETQILEKRVVAAKSHMMDTCFVATTV